MTSARLAVFLILVLGLVHEGQSQDTTITYQGQLHQSGEPFTGTADLEFRLWNQLAGGGQVGSTQSRPNWPVEEGLFQVELNFGANAFTGQARFLEVRVNGAFLSPRQAIRPSPMALFALGGNEGPAGPTGPAGPQGPAGDSHWQINGLGTYYSSGRVGIGTNSPQRPLDVVSSASAIRGVSSATSGDTEGVFGDSNSTSGRGVFGLARASSGSTSGVYGSSFSTSGRGVFGRASASSGSTSGVWGESDSTSGRGVFGQATASSGSTSGVWGGSDSTSGTGVLGWAKASSGSTRGVWGQSDSTSGRGVYGRAFAASGTTYGVFGETNSPNGFAAYFTGPSGSRNYFQRAIGIGTESPEAQLHVLGPSPGGDPFGQLRLEGTETSGAEGTGAGLSFLGHDGAIRRVWGYIETVKENSTSGNTRSRMSFYTRGVSGLPAERLRINSNGATFNTTGTWSTFSDRRLKRDIAPLTGALDQLLQLEGVRFEYIDPETALSGPGARMGFVAQQVDAVFPDWVGEDERGYKFIAPTGFDALMVEALRELKDQQELDLAELRADNLALRSQLAVVKSLAERNVELEARLASLEEMLLVGRRLAESE